MLETKPALTSKTVLTNLALAALAVLAFFGIVPALDEQALAGIAVIGNLAAAWFRKKATAQLG